MLFLGACGGGSNTPKTNTGTNKLNTLSKGLVAHYKFEGNTKDSSGNGYDGSSYGGVSYTRGVRGLATNFDGIDDYIDMKNISEVITKNPWSYSVWLNKKDTVTGGTIMNARNLSAVPGDSHNRKNGLLWFDPSGRIVSVSKGSSDYNQIKKYGKFYEKDKWYHIVYTYDGNNNHTIHIDGAIDTKLTAKSKGSVKLFDNIAFEVGRHLYLRKKNYFFKGKIDSLRIYNRLLSEKEIKELYKNKE